MSGAWSTPDAVALTALASTRRRDRDAVISAVDACNHDVMSEQDFVGAIGRLIGAGLVSVVDGPKFMLTREGRNLARRRKGRLIEQVCSVCDLLSELPISDQEWVLPRGLYDEAVQRYLDR